MKCKLMQDRNIACMDGLFQYEKIQIAKFKVLSFTQRHQYPMDGGRYQILRILFAAKNKMVCCFEKHNVTIKSMGKFASMTMRVNIDDGIKY